MKTKRTLLPLALLLGSTSFAHATVLGFGQIGGSNFSIEVSLPTYGSNATADSNGVSVANGTTPNITLTWGNDWDVHTSGQFNTLENLTAGGGNWDNGNSAGTGTGAQIGQLDTGNQFITFAADAGYALVLNSFDFGHTAETPGTTVWDVTLTNSLAAVVWSQSVTFVNGSAITLSPNFTGTLGESYTLRFNRTSSTYGSDGRHGLDNLSFNQVPEPGAAGLLGLAGLTLLLRRRK